MHRFYPDVAADGLQRGLLDQDNPSGCLNDLFPWVEVTIGCGSDTCSTGTLNPPTNWLGTGEGSTAMEFFNVSEATLLT